MIQKHRRHRGMQVMGWREPEWRGYALVDLPEPLRGLLRPEDPDLDFILISLVSLHESGLDVLDPDVAKLAIEGGRKVARECERRLKEHPARHAEDRAERSQALEEASLVYYARLGNRVKIGYSTNMANRLADIRPEELLATEPGGPLLEKRRHGQFADLRVVGEWFKFEGALVDHVRALAA
jgi:Meiotically Up-regulated Gene 113 (MUG113) protein